MHDVQLEDRLRNALRAEGDSLPFSITVEELELRLRERQRGRLTRRSGLAAAAVFGAIAVGSAAMFLGGRGPAPDVATSPSPSASSIQGLAIPEHVLWGAAEPVLDVSSDNPPAGEAPSASPGELFVGRLPAAAEYEVAYVCRGTGTMLVRMADADWEGIPCNGLAEYVTFTLASDSDGEDVRVVVDAATDWRVLVLRPSVTEPSGDYPEDLTTTEEMLDLLGEGGTFTLSSERAGDPGDAARGEWVVGSFEADRYAESLWDCSGEGPFAMSWADEQTGARAGGFEIEGCDGPAQVVTMSDLPAEVRLTVSAQRDTAWRLVVADTARGPSPSPGLPEIVPTGVGRVAVDELREGNDGEGDVTRELGQVPAADGYVLSAVCLGTGEMEFRLGGDAVSGFYGGGQLATCDGTPARHSLETPSAVALPLSITAPADAQWHVIVEVIGEAEALGRGALGAPDDAVVVRVQPDGSIQVGVLRLGETAFEGAIEPEEVFTMTGEVVPDGYTVTDRPARASADGWVALPLTQDGREGPTDILIVHPRDTSTAWVVEGNLGHGGWGPDGRLAVSTGSTVSIHAPEARTTETVDVPAPWTVGRSELWGNTEAWSFGVEAITWFADGRRLLVHNNEASPFIGALGLDGSVEPLTAPVPLASRSGTEPEYNAERRYLYSGCPTEGGDEGCATIVGGGDADNETWRADSDGFGQHLDALWDAEGDGAWFLLLRDRTDTEDRIVVAHADEPRNLTDVGETVVVAEGDALPQRFAAIRDARGDPARDLFLVQRYDGRLAFAVSGAGDVAEVLGDWHFAGWAGEQEPWPAP